MAASSRPFRLGIRNAYGRPLYHWARTWARTFAVEVGDLNLSFSFQKKTLFLSGHVRAGVTWRPK